MNNLLRPKKFLNFIGQDKIKKTLKVMMESSKMNDSVIDHILFYGPSGSGKTTLALIIANEMNFDIKIVQGSSLQKKADILVLFTAVKEKQIIFIDEIHGMDKSAKEMIYSILERGKIEIIIGSEGNSRLVQFQLPAFTLIGSTTELYKISSPLKNRFGAVFKIGDYSANDILQIIEQSALTLKITISGRAKKIIASHCSYVPRIANNLLKRCYDFATVRKSKKITSSIVIETLSYLGIYKFGLTDFHLKYLKILQKFFNKKHVTLETIAKLMECSKEDIIRNIEPQLLVKSFVAKNSKGRRITDKGRKYLKEILAFS